MLGELYPPGRAARDEGRVPPSLTLLMSSLPSSRMVRSAAKLVSKTRSKPSLLTAASIFPVTRVPGGIAELLTEGGPDCGSILDHDELLRDRKAPSILRLRSTFPLWRPRDRRRSTGRSMRRPRQRGSLSKAGSTLLRNPCPERKGRPPPAAPGRP